MALLVLLSATAAAQVPRQIAHEGRVLRADGTPERGIQGLTFAMYTVASGGSAAWSETHFVTLSADGYYAVLLGRQSPLPAFDLPHWLGITLQGEAEMAPRASFAAVPFALRAAAADPGPGETPATARASCQALYNIGVRVSGTYFIDPSGASPLSTWCEMTLNGGGWTMVYNSVIGSATTEFWNIPYADRLGRKGSPVITSNFYEGAIYSYGRTFMDVVEDQRGKQGPIFVATTTGISTASMVFTSPALVSGATNAYNSQFASGWSAVDFDGDAHAGMNCSIYGGAATPVTQHYSDCFNYNLGLDAESPNYDGGLGPHLSPSSFPSGLTTDGTGHSRVRRISRFTKW